MKASRKKLAATFLTTILLGAFIPAYAKNIKITATPIENFLPENSEKTQFGKLEFIGGLELTSKNKNFGGLSGLRITEDGKTLFAVTDQGHFLKADIIRDSSGKISALERAEFSRLRDRKDDKLKGKSRADAESLEIFGNQFLIGFERKHRVDFFNQSNGKLKADSKSKPISFKRFNFPNNKGPEAIAISPLTKEVFVFAEYALDKKRQHQGFIVKDETITPIAITLTTGYSLTDAHFLNNGDLLILERFYTPITGQAMRIRKILSQNLKANTILSGEIIMQATSQMEIDNMEGLAISKMQDSSTRLTLISDDNFSRSQRTILLEFKLID